MIRKVIGVFVVLAALVAVGYALIPSDRDEAVGLSSAVVSTAPSDLEKIIEAPGGTELLLGADNTTIGFSCAKTLAGKTVVVRGGWSGRFGSVIEGVVNLDSGSLQPRLFRARVRIDSLWSEHDQLTEALLTKGFFDPQSHPWATFEGVYEASDDGSYTGKILGDFDLNGVRRRIEFPARIQVTDDQLEVVSEFSLNRHVFGVSFQESGGYGLLTDEDIADDVAVSLTIRTRIGSGTVAVGVRDTASDMTTGESPRSISAADLPPSFIQTIPTTQVDFDMVLVPGDPEKGIAPFYIGKHEVTWDAFMPWVRGEDLADEAQVGEQRALKLRPSSPYGSVDRNFGMYRRPALGMSRMSAELYCRWLSEQTGRRHRLPTEAEWMLAYGRGAPVEAPASPGEADAMATYEANAWDDSLGDWATTKIGSREPNALGIHDMAGNVAEWVVGTGEQRVVRGGHFESPLSELGVGRHVEDVDAWNRDYPNEPKSQWWYVNARWVGFRVACDPLPIGDTEPE